jgi:beta-galactosidase/beta-glucuronidase
LCRFVFFVAKKEFAVSGKIEITVGDVNDVEARVCAHFTGEGIVRLSGTLRGPYCETARTLPAEIAFRPAEGSGVATAEVCVPDPCVWTEEVPHMYQVDLEARQGNKLVAEYHGRIGLRRSPNAPPRSASWPDL